MLAELERLITKYSGAEWNTKPTAIRLVEILTEHRVLLQVELAEVNSGARRLTVEDFLGPQERVRRQESTHPEKTDVESDAAPEKKKHTRYFIALEQKRFENKRREIKGTARRSDGKSAMSDVDFIAALSDALAHIRTLEAAGGLAQGAATDLVERVRKVASQARVMLTKDQ